MPVKLEIFILKMLNIDANKNEETSIETAAVFKTSFLFFSLL